MKIEIQSHLAMVSLHDISPGTCARLLRVGGEQTFRRRLMELGFLPGTLIRLIRRVNVGDLVELEVRGCHVSLRRAEANQLFVEQQDA
jgi:ferrous iron transport protein A